MANILEIKLTNQLDASASRQRTRHIAALCGFSSNVQTRLATTVSELARAAMDEERPGYVAFNLIEVRPDKTLLITVSRQKRTRPKSDSTLELTQYVPLPMEEIAESARGFLDIIEIDKENGLVRLGKDVPQTDIPVTLNQILTSLKKANALTGDAALSEARQKNHELEVSNGIYLARNDQLQSQANSLISADQKKDEFLAILAHELRGPLSAMAMAGKLLEKGAHDPERIVRMGQTITRQTAHMTRLVEDLLDVSRIVRSEISIEKKPVDLREAVIDALEQLSPSAQHRKHHVAAHLPDNPVMVSGDRTRLIQVLGNLIGNSIRYTPDGGKISVTLHNDANGIHVKVKDNGIGIAAEKLPSLFDLFVQAQRSTDSRNSGLGLGLTLVKALMEAHQGTVAVHSDGPGLGSQFDIVFPIPNFA